MKKKIVCICPTERDRRELERFSQEYDIHFYDTLQKGEIITSPSVGRIGYSFEAKKAVNDLLAFMQDYKPDGIISSDDYPGNILASIAATHQNLPGPSIESIMRCQHKYYARLDQHAIVPEATPGFCMLTLDNFEQMEAMEYPLFIKPIKSRFSMFASHAAAYKDLKKIVHTMLMPPEFMEQFNWFVKEYAPFQPLKDYLIVEACLKGVQSTLEGYVYNGNVIVRGIVDSIMFPETISFKRFDYPSSLPESVQDRMAVIAKRLMNYIKFDNSFFNIEYMYDSEYDRISIIEVNPRMVSQFADLYEKVDGLNSYTQQLQLALGKNPTRPYGNGEHALASSCVLRLFENKRVIKSPGLKQIEQLYTEFPDARAQFYVKVGDLLSDTSQDGNSYRYGLIHLAGRDAQDIAAKLARCEQIIDFQFTQL